MDLVIRKLESELEAATYARTEASAKVNVLTDELHRGQLKLTEHDRYLTQLETLIIRLKAESRSSNPSD